MDAGFIKHGFVHAGEHGHGDDERRMAPLARGGLARGVARRLHHPRAARGVNVDHPDAERRRGRYRGRHRVGNVVKLEVEENAGAVGRERPDDIRAFGGEKTAADFEGADDVAEVVAERQSRDAVLYVQGDYELIHACSRRARSRLPVRSARRVSPCRSM